MIQLKGKQRFFTALVLVAFLMAAEVFGEEQTHRADLSVTASKKRDEKITTEQNQGSTTKIKTETVTLEIEVENGSKERDTYTIVWASLAKHGSSNTTQVVFESEKKTITLDAAEIYTNTIKLKPFVFTEKNTTRYYTSGRISESSQTKNGDAYLGYIVLVMAGNEVIAEESSSSRFLKDEWVEKVKKAARIE